MYGFMDTDEVSSSSFFDFLMLHLKSQTTLGVVLSGWYEEFQQNKIIIEV